MATTVNYKNATLTTVTNQTKVLKTGGTWLEDDIEIIDVTSGGSAVVVTEEDDEHGGVIKHITAVDLSNDTVSAATLLQGYTAHNYLGEAITGTYSGGTFQEKTVTPTTATQNITADYGYNGLSKVTVNAIPNQYIVPTGSLNITSNNTYDVTNYASAVVNVSSTINNQNKIVNPSTSQQQITADTGYTGLGTVTVNAMPNGTAGTPTATKGTVSNNTISITPNVTNTAGYIDGGTKTGTAVTVSASELVSGSQTITSNGTVNVINLAEVVVNVPSSGGGGIYQDQDGYLVLSPDGGGSGSLPLKVGVIRPDAELIQKWTYDRMLVADEGLTIPSAYSTTSQTIRAAQNIDTYEGDPLSYRYFITEQCLTIPSYSIATKAKGREEYVFSVGAYEWVYQTSGQMKSLDGSVSYGQYSQMNAVGPISKEIYWSSATNVGVYTSPAYCLNQTLAAPAIASNKTITIKSPSIAIRGHTTYLTQEFYEAITDARLQYIIELWRVPLTPNVIEGWTFESMTDKVLDDINNNNGTLR